MIVEKKINNNFALCRDSNNQAIVAYGKGIGFGKTPYELTDLSKVEQTFYNIDDQLISLVNQIPDDIFEVAIKIVNIANIRLNTCFPRKLVISLADHISFAIERKKKNIFIANPLGRDVRYLYKRELEIGEIAIRTIKTELGVVLPSQESTNIAIHFITAETDFGEVPQFQSEVSIINDITELIEKELSISIDKDNINYSRFLIHLQYLLKRNNTSEKTSKDSLKLLGKMKVEFPEIYDMACKVGEYIWAKLKWKPNQEELLYLMIHINRFYDRTGCNR